MKYNIKKDNLQTQLKLERVPRAASAAILSSALSAFIFNGIFGTDLENTPIFSVMFLCAVFTSVIEFITAPNVILLSGAALSFCAGGALFFIPFGGSGLYDVLLNGEDITTVRALPMVLLLCGALCFAVCMLNRSFVARCIIAGGLMIMLIVLVWLRFTLLTVPAILITAYILIVICQICASKVACAAEIPRNMWFVIFCLATAVLVFVLPHPNTRIQWEKVFYINSSEQLDELGEKLDIEQINSESGYSEDQSSLGGWIDSMSELNLLVSFSDSYHSDRLTGGIYDNYTGTGWIHTTEINGTGYYSALEISASDLSSVSDSDILYVSCSDLCGSVYISDNFDEMPEKDAEQIMLFYPPYSYIVSSDEMEERAVSDGKRLMFEQSSGHAYNAYYYKQPCEYNLTDAEREHYLSLPETLPERVRELALTSTEGCDDDESKAYELMRILHICEYETRVRPLPEGRDFVDYFLFDSNKGYCAYFASAMAVLARCVDIPSRYVQGYYINSNNKLEVAVSSDNAHAWAELYIDGCWIIYDPVTSPAENIVTGTDENEPLRDTSALRNILLYSYSITAAAAIVFIAIKPFLARISWHIKMKRKHDKNNGYLTIVHCGKTLWVLSSCGIKPTEAETLTEFGKRVCDECEWLDDTTGEELCRFLEQANKVLYSSVNGAECMQENVARTIRRAYIRNFGLIKYLHGYRRASM